MNLGRDYSGLSSGKAKSCVWRSSAAMSLALFGSAIFAAGASAGVIDRPFFRANAIVIVFGASDFTENSGTAPVVFDFAMLNSAPGTAATDIIADDGVTINYNTGRYNPSSDGSQSGWEMEITGQTSGGVFTSGAPHQTLDENDAFTAFGLDDDTDVDLLGGGNRASRFFVASNAAFDIYGEASDLVATGGFSAMDYSNIRYRLNVQRTGGSGVNRWGQFAQNPANGGSGVVIGQNNSFRLDDLAAGPVKVFDGGRRTAAQRGSIMQQAVSFRSRYNLVGSGINGNTYDLSMGAGALGAQVTYTVYTP